MNGTRIPSENVQAEPALSSKEWEWAEREVAHIFRHANPQHPMMQELMRLCVTRRARQLQGRL